MNDNVIPVHGASKKGVCLLCLKPSEGAVFLVSQPIKGALCAAHLQLFAEQLQPKLPPVAVVAQVAKPEMKNEVKVS